MTRPVPTHGVGQPHKEIAVRRTLLTITAALATFASTTPMAFADSPQPIKYPAEIQGVWYIVTKDDAVMRAGEEEVFYAVAKFPAGTMIVAASNTDRYAAAYYPLSLGALVPVGEVDRVDETTVALIEESTLRAPSSLLGMSGSWKGLYSIPLLIGTELEIIEELKSGEQTVGYKVVAPRPPVASSHPVGFIKMSDLRPASASEVEAFLGKPAPKPTTKPATKTMLDPVEIDQVETIPATTIDTTLMDPINEPEPEPEPEPITEPETKPEPAEPQATDAPVIIDNVVIVPDKSASPKASDAAILSASALETLEAAFTHARSLPREELDNALEELLAEYTRAFDAAGEDETSLARALSQRMEWLNIRIETRDQRRAIAATLRQADANQAAIEAAIKEWQAGRSYIIVGRMVPSAVYTGERLPLLYRVQSNDPIITGIQTTIGYIAPSEDQDYRHLLGRVVGVIGSAQLDEALNLRIIRPARIDAMPE